MNAIYITCRVVSLMFLCMPVLLGESPEAEPKPQLEMMEAVKIASKFAEKNKDLKGYYMDRAWITRIKGEKERKWAISWSPDANSKLPNPGWYIVIVDMNGSAYEPKGGVPWIGAKSQ